MDLKTCEPHDPKVTVTDAPHLSTSIDPMFDLPKFILSADTIYWICNVFYLYVDTLQINQYKFIVSN